MDLLGYSDTMLHVCLHGLTRRAIHDILRQVFVVPHKMRICPCVTDVWTRTTLSFLGAVYDNEPSRECARHGARGEFASDAKEPDRSGRQHAV